MDLLFRLLLTHFPGCRNLYPDKHAELDAFQTHLSETSHEIGALKVWQFQELSHQAAERILSSSPAEALNVLTDIAQNFPIQAKSLIRTKVSNEMKKEMKQNQDIFFGSLHIQPSDTALFINGLFFDLDSVDVLSLLESLRGELRVMEALHKIGEVLFVFVHQKTRFSEFSCFNDKFPTRRIQQQKNGQTFGSRSFGGFREPGFRDRYQRFGNNVGERHRKRFSLQQMVPFAHGSPSINFPWNAS